MTAPGVRGDLVEAIDRAWQRIANPGTWWSGAERVAIAEETRRARRCALCRERREALSPAHVTGEHDHAGRLPAAAVDAVHRLTTDASRLSRSSLESWAEQGLADTHYVELVGVVVQTISVDQFQRGAGLPVRELPEPIPGEPKRRRPAGAGPDQSWVPMIAQADLEGPDAGLYGPGGRTGNVIRALSLVPDEVRALLDLSAAMYLSPHEMRSFEHDRALDRAQIELVAGRVSALNECFY